MSPAGFTYGPALEVARELMRDDNVTQGDLTGALINALTRIDVLERQIRNLQDMERNK